MEKKQFPPLKRHQTFSIRDGWIEKGLNILIDDKNALKKDEGPAKFGLGSNMCKSLRYWLIASNLFSFQQKGAEPTELGKLLYKYDQYLECDFSWWLIHLYLVSNFEDAPVLNSIFNLNYSKFDKELVFNKIKEIYSNEYDIGADSSLKSDISIAFKSYYSDDLSNPEDNKNCPLSKLSLLKTDDKKVFYRTSPMYKKLDYRIVYLAIIKCFNEKQDKIKFNVEDIYEMKNNPINLLGITKTMLFMYLEEMKTSGLLDIYKTAGLNVVYIEKIRSITEVIESYFKEA